VDGTLPKTITRKAADTAGRSQKIGYNNRLHPAIMNARQIVDRGELGPLMFIRGR
jgi:predicted dehydrogenase